ncbi:MAG: FtsW/RodA/SpoVE family cell cycle protein [Gorillibacterium sp.]|nr:FtsW/RodA/SpoVE family cell cycle protein [Gorillibacterium sp.]
MSPFTDNPKIRQFVQQACGAMKPGKLRDEIALELEDHLDEAMEEERAAGVSEQEAAVSALRRMGDPVTLGKSLWSIHKPRIDLAVLIPLALLIGFGLMLSSSLSLAAERFAGVPFLAKQLLMGILGISMAAAIRLLDYRKLQKLAWPLYGATILFSALPFLLKDFYSSFLSCIHHQLRFGTTMISPTSFSPYLFLLSIVGILSSPWWRRAAESKRRAIWFSMIVAVCFLLVPVFFFAVTPDYSSGMIYLVVCTIMMIKVRTSWKQFTLIFVPFLLFSTVVLGFLSYSPSYLPSRIYSTAFLQQLSDPSERAYMTLSSIKAIRSAGFWGQGYGAQLDYLGGINTEMAFSYLIFSLGWIVGVILAGILLFLFVRLFRISSKVTNSFGRQLITGILSLFAIQVIWNLGMSFGLLPIRGVVLPFLSYGPLQLFFQLLIMGIMLSVLRRRTMLGSSQVVVF